MEYQITNFKPLDLSDLSKQVDTFVATVNNQPETLVQEKPQEPKNEINYTLYGFGLGVGAGLGYSIYKKYGTKKGFISVLVSALIGSAIGFGIALTKEN